MKYTGIIGYFVPDETEQPAVQHFTVRDREQTYRVTVWERAQVDSLWMPWPNAESTGGAVNTISSERKRVV